VGVATALTCGAVVGVPQVAFAADPFSPTDMVATQSNSSEIVALDRVTGATTAVLTAPNGATGLNQIGLSGDGNTLMLTNTSTIFEYTASTESWETTSRAGVTVAGTMGGVDPVSGLYYFGGQADGSTFTFATYDPATNGLSGGLLTVTAPGAPGGNGDVAFDSRGNLYFVSSSTTAAQVYRVDAAQLAAGGAVTAATVGPVIGDAGTALNSMAFADDGYMYIAGSGANGFLQVNPVTGAILERRNLSIGITDLGTNAVPFTAAVTAELPDGRFTPGDQFTVTIGGGGISTGNTGTTTGTETSETVGPLLILPGETYTIEQTPAGTTDLDNYETVWTCIDPATGAVITSGTGNSGSFTVPDGVSDVSCTFTSTPLAAPAANDDEDLDNPLGTPVTVDVIGNDTGDLDPSTVRIVDGGGDPVTELEVPGEGTWTVDPTTGAITFTPEAGFSGNPTPITYEVSDDRGNPTTAEVTVGFAPEAADDEDLNNAQGTPVTVDVVANDLGDLDPTTVGIRNGAGDPVTELVVTGEGTWTVDPATGAITFAPEAGFSGNPTAITYEVADTLGNVATADVVVTYVPEAADDESLNNPQGTPVSVDVVGNDSGDIDPTTVGIINGAGDPVTEFVVEGEGTWTVDPTTGAITFTPEDGFSGNPTPITYEVSDAAGNTTTADVVITFVPEAADDSSLDNEQGTPVTVDVVGNDLGEIDPTTVGIIDGAGDPVTELVVDGEGTWTVDPATGAITFTPEAGFTGDPTPISYEVSDAAGNTTTATVTVTYAAAPVTPPAPGDDGEQPSPAPAPGSDLAVTGAEPFGVAIAGLGLALLGLALVLLRRRGHQQG
jgi:CshA-type fibril repeat protein